MNVEDETSDFDIARIDEVIHGRVRLGIMAYLSGVESADFGELKARLQTTDWGVMALMPTVVMGAYGSAWMVVAAISRKAWLNVVGLISYAGAVVLAGLGDPLLIYPVYLVLLIAVALAPGLILVRGATKKAG